MIGALIGDIVGSVYEFHNLKSKEFPLFTPENCPTDDSIMTLAIAQAVLSAQGDLEALPQLAVQSMVALGNRYPNAGYGGRFYQWLQKGKYTTPKPYNSFGNGSAMRVSPCGFAADSLDQAIAMARQVTKVTHNHPEGMKGAEATAAAVYLAKAGQDKQAIRQYILENYYDISFTLDEIRPTYTFDVSCQGSVPQALEAFFESVSFEDAIRSAVSIGGDSDTIAAIAGGIAEAYYGVPASLRAQAMPYLTLRQKTVLQDFEERFPPRVIEEA